MHRVPASCLLAIPILALMIVPAGAQEQTSEPEGPAAPVTNAGGPPPAVEEITVTGSSVTDAVDQARFAESVVDVLTAEDFAASGDSGVVDALSRLTGVTTVGGRFVYVRGLSERYSSTLFNGATLPSPDPYRRVLPLDLFPSGVMDQLSVQKSYSPTLPADFAGGSVQMTTRGVPAESEFHFDIELKGNSRTTGRNEPWFKGGDADWTGFDDGFRDLPGGLRDLTSATPADQKRAAGLAIDRSWNVDNEPIPPGYEIEGSYANRWKTRIGDIGLMLGAEGENDWHYRKEQHATQRPGTKDDTIAFDTQRQNNNDVNYAGLGSLNWSPATSQLVKATLFWTHQTQKRYWVTDPRYNAYEDQFFRDVTAEFEERQLLTTQLTGSHEIERLHDLLFDWTATWSEATRKLPDSRYYGFRYFDDDFSDGLDPDSLLLNRAANNTRTWEDLTDDAWDVVANASLPLQLHEKLRSTLRTGVKYFDKQRESEFLQFRYVDSNFSKNWPNYNDLPIDQIFSDDNIGPVWTLQNFSDPKDQYESGEEVIAAYLQSDFEIGSSLRLMVGTRYESYTSTTDTAETDPTELEDSAFYPAVELTWLIRDDLQLRAAWSQTVNRPDLRELAPAQYYNREEQADYIGNPNLQVAELTNYDLRLEWYHGLNDSLELAAFYKDIQNPIQEYDAFVGVTSTRTFDNAEEAYLWGIEAAAQQSLAPLGRWADDFTVRANAAFIQSEATESPTKAVTSLKHPLQGQSDWVVNFQVTHDYIPWDLQQTLSFNMFGERLDVIGAKPPTAPPGSGQDDRYEQPVPSLDYTLRWGFALFDEDFTLTFKARNLLDPKFEWKRAQVSERSFREGTDFSLEIGYDF